VLKRLDFLDSLSVNKVQEFVSIVSEQRFGKGACIVHKGDPGHHFYVIRSGNVSIMNEELVGRKILGAYEYFGEVALLSEVPRTADVVAETEVADVTPKIEGFVERLYVNATGAPVRKGQPLLALYAPMLVAVQEELLTARRLVAELAGAGGDAEQRAQAMLDATRRRLGYWDISAEQVARLEQTGEVTRTLTLASPVSGVVLEKEVVEGQRVMPGMRLYRIANLDQVWVEGELFEQDLTFVREGSQAHIEVAAYRGEHRMVGSRSSIPPWTPRAGPTGCGSWSRIPTAGSSRACSPPSISARPCLNRSRPRSTPITLTSSRP